jgi:hypothetical protein
MASINGFQLFSKMVSTDNLLDRVLAVPSTQFFKNDALNFDAYGRLQQVTATGKCTHVYTSMETPSPLLRPGTADLSTTNGERIFAIPAMGNLLRFRTYLIGNSVPYRYNIAANANTTLNTALITDAGSTGDVLGGQVYIATLNWQSPILTDVVSAGVRTITFLTTLQTEWNQITLPRAVTTGDTVTAVGWSKGAESVQFNATTPSQGLSNTVAGKSGGNIRIEDVVLGPLANTASQVPSLPYAVVSFPEFSLT